MGAVLTGWPTEGSPFVFPAEAGNGSFQGTEKVWRKVRKEAKLTEVRLRNRGRE